MRLRKNYYRLINNKIKLKYNIIGKLTNSETYNKTKLNKKFKEIYKNERCFILGNGPSLNQEDLSLLENEYVFTVNQIVRHKDYAKIKPNYHFWADPVFFNIDKNKPEDLELLDSYMGLNTENNKPECFFPVEAESFLKEFSLDKYLNVNYFNSKLILDDYFDGNFEFDKVIVGFYTVVHWAISMAIYMGFKEIYLLGCDTTTILSKINLVLERGDIQYAYNVSENEKLRVQKNFERYSMEVQMRVESEVLKGYRILNEVAVKKGIKMFNCSKTTIVDSVQRMEFEQVIAKKA